MDELTAAARAAGRGDRDAFETIVRATQADVWRFCRWLTGDEERTRDAVQETYARAQRALGGYRGRAPVRAYLLGIARHVAADQARAAAPVPVARVPAGRAPDHAERVVLARLVENLPVKLREAFVLTQVIGLSYADVATVLRCPVGTVRSRVHRAREALVTAWRADEQERA